LAKNVYQLHGVDRSGKTVWKRRLKRHQWFQVLLDTAGPECDIRSSAKALNSAAANGPEAAAVFGVRLGCKTTRRLGVGPKGVCISIDKARMKVETEAEELAS
jgi:hypothetical protein